MGYEIFYQLKCEPFALNPDPRFYFNSPQHAIARDHLMHAASHGKGLALLLGPIGTGKTTLTRRLFTELSNDESYVVGLITVVHSVKPEWLSKKIATVLGVEEPATEFTALFSQIVSYLQDIHAQAQKTVIFIDEANKIEDPETLEELRGFLNLETEEGKKLITFILIGLPELEDHISQNPPLRQRVAVRVFLKPLSPDTVKAYLTHRLTIAGCRNGLFTEKAIEAVTKYSKGIPRLVNIICDNALLEGYMQRKPTIDEFIIEKIAKNLNLIES